MHDHVKSLLSAYVDDELDSEETSIIDHHVALCEECKHELDHLMFMKKEIMALFHFVEAPDEQFEQSVMKEIADLSWKKRNVFRPLLLGSTFAFVFLFGLVFLKMGHFLFIGMKLATAFVKMALSVVHALVAISSSIPSIFGVFIITSLIIIAISGWSIRYLLETNTTG
ncbi:MAG: hypothetical protein K0S25_2071 [Bacillus sp. (in: firmicutes)]|nr:hypothetical protein [Bacillus sp. (in: firmicutes)]